MTFKRFSNYFQNNEKMIGFDVWKIFLRKFSVSVIPTRKYIFASVKCIFISVNPKINKTIKKIRQVGKYLNY